MYIYIYIYLLFKFGINVLERVFKEHKSGDFECYKLSLIRLILSWKNKVELSLS